MNKLHPPLFRGILALALMMFLTGCASAPPVMPSGEWTGSVSAENGISYPVEVNFLACGRGDVCAQMNYSSLNCESELKFIRTKQGSPVFEETITAGDYCKSGRTVQMTYVDGNTPLTLQWFERNGDLGPSASLNSGRAVEPTQAPLSIPGFGSEVFSLQNQGLFINWKGELADGSLWLPDSHSGNLIRFDTHTHQVVATIRVGDPAANRSNGYDPNDVAVAGDQVWVTQRAEKAVGRIDPVTNTLAESVPLPNVPYDLVIADNILWISSFEGDVVMRMDLATRTITSTYVNKPLGVTVGGGAVWVVEHRNGNLVRLDEQTADFVTRIDLSLPPPNLGAQPEEVIFAEGSVWVANNGGRTVSRVDPLTNEILATIQFEGRLRPVRFAVGGGFIWVSVIAEVGSGAGDFIAQIDPATNVIVKLTPFERVHFLIYDDGTLWVADGYGDADKRAGDRIFEIKLEK